MALLITTAATLGGEVKDAISFCNVLFVGNLCASLVVLVSFGPKTITHDLKRVRLPLFLEVLGFASLAALLSTLIFNALQTTTVTNAVLLARLGPVLYVIGAAVLFGQIISKSEWAGFGLIALGSLSTVFAGNGIFLATGDFLLLASTGIYAIAALMSKRLLPEIGVPALLFIRNFFFLSCLLYHRQCPIWTCPFWACLLLSVVGHHGSVCTHHHCGLTNCMVSGYRNLTSGQYCKMDFLHANLSRKLRVFPKW